MKWNSKPKPKRVIPLEGDVKEKIRFAIFPVKVQDQWLWWEKYIAVYQYKTFWYPQEIVVSEGIFTEKYYTKMTQGLRWIVIDRKHI